MLFIGKLNDSFFGGIGFMNYLLYSVLILLFFINCMSMLLMSVLNCGLFLCSMNL